MSFDIILKELATTVGAEGAIMLDYDAEMVAAFSESTTSDIGLIGAHHAVIFNIIKNVSSEKGGKVEVKSVVITTGGNKLIITAIKDGYCLVLVMDKAKSTGLALIESEKTIKKLEEEMG